MTRNWFDNYGQDGMFWNLPIQTTAIFITSGAQITAIRQGSGHIHLPGDFSIPFVRGVASHPIVTIHDATGAVPDFTMHMPLGTVQEQPITGTDNGLGALDETIVGALFNLNTVTMNTNGVQASGTVITCHNGVTIDDAFGPIMMDRVTGQPGSGNAFGAIQDFELTLANADPNYFPQHMLAYELDASQMNSATAIWPLLYNDTSFPDTGGVNQGLTLAIPPSVPMPSGLTRGQQMMWKIAQQYGFFFYNQSGNGTLSMDVFWSTPANEALANDIASGFNTILQALCILNPGTGPNYTSGPAGSQYSVATMKGMVGGVRSDAFPAPALLDLSPLGGVEVAPNTIGPPPHAFYPSGYNVTPVAPSGGIQIPGAPVGLTVGTITSSSVALSWTTPSSGGAVNTYLIDDRVGNTGTFVQIFTTTGTAYAITGLQPSTTYNFEVFGQNAAGTGPASNIVSVTTPAAVTVATVQAQVTQLENIASQLTSILTSASTNVGLL